MLFTPAACVVHTSCVCCSHQLRVLFTPAACVVHTSCVCCSHSSVTRLHRYESPSPVRALNRDARFCLTAPTSVLRVTLSPGGGARGELDPCRQKSRRQERGVVRPAVSDWTGLRRGLDQLQAQVSILISPSPISPSPISPLGGQLQF